MGVKFDNITESLTDNNVETHSPKTKGYFLSIQKILLCVILVILMCIVVGLLAAYLGPGRRLYNDDDEGLFKENSLKNSHLCFLVLVN